MSISSQKYTGTQYTATATFLLLAIAAPPLTFLAAGPLWSLPIAASLAFSSVCFGVAWSQWKWRSELTIPSILMAQQPARAR